MSSKGSQISRTFGQLTLIDSSATKTGSTSSVVLRKTPASITVATGDATLTVSQAVSGIISQTPAADSTLTLPSASALITQFGGANVGDTFNLTIINQAAATHNSILAVPGSGTLVGSGIVAALGARTFAVRFTNVASGTEAYTVYTI
jgi:hypothetical protein